MFTLFSKRTKYRFFYLCYLFFRFCPVRKKLVLFESLRDCSDNSWAMYLWLKEHRPNYELVWLCHSAETLKRQRTDGKTRFLLHDFHFESWADSRAVAQAGTIFLTHGINSKIRRRKGQNIVNLWHGIALKAPKSGKAQNQMDFNIVLSLSEENKHNQAVFIGCDEALVKPLGYPRNDLLLKNKGWGKDNLFAPKGWQGKVVVWMPTFRGSVVQQISEAACDTDTGLPLLTTPESIVHFNAFLAKAQIYMIVKIHPLQTGKEVFKQTFSHLLFLTDSMLVAKGVQVYEMLGRSDALLTDYSSVFFDYFILDKPIGFILSDMEEYRKSRGEFVMDNPLDVMAGRHIYSAADLEAFLMDLVAGFDKEADWRRQMAKHVIAHPDEKSCERIANYCQL